jgi:hypothetical protein
MSKKSTEVKTPTPTTKTGPERWLEYAATARGNAAKEWNPEYRVWEMIESLRCEVRAEGLKNEDDSLVVAKANEYAARYPNGKPLEELKAETRAYLGELIAKLS